MEPEAEDGPAATCPLPRRPVVVRFERHARNAPRETTVIRLPSFESVRDDPVLEAHASRLLHLESNPGNARALVQPRQQRCVVEPPPIPLEMQEMDQLYELPYQRVPHPIYDGAHIPAYHMIRFSVAIQRGCFGGCTFCSITEHEGRIIQNRSEDSIVREVETIRDNVPGFTGVVSDLGGPTANMYRISCKSPEIEASRAAALPVCFRGLQEPQYESLAAYSSVSASPGASRHQTRVYCVGGSV